MDWILRLNGLPESPLPAGSHNVAVFGMRERFTPERTVSPDTVVIDLMRGIWQTVARFPESVRGTLPSEEPPF
jgi:hypothetical protein